MNPTLTARLALLEREKALLRLSDEIARERRALPWTPVDTAYVFDGPDGPRPLADLFGPHRQLVVQHFMLGPDWDEGCPSCSFMADHTDGMLPHLAQRDVAFCAVSRAPIERIERFRHRMGWHFPWVSSFHNGFNTDFGVSFPADRLVHGVDYNYTHQPFPHEEAPGVSVFAKDEAGRVFHTYSTYGRGVEVMMGTYRLLDLVPKGRDETSPDVGHTMDWVRHHDRYGPAATAGSCCGSHR